MSEERPDDFGDSGTGITPTPSTSPVHKHRAILTFLLIGILSFSFVIHYFTVAFITGCQTNKIEKLSEIFNTWLPIISGLTGGAVTYYFTKANEK